VAQIAAAFGGGGHAKAAGFPAPGGVEETIKAIRTAIEAARDPAAHRSE
jgi:nanoRNase/pAp phosphatase (c-di-AMP/oligoRNAs hydrolase)